MKLYIEPCFSMPLNFDHNPRQAELTPLDIWVQVHDLVGVLRSERVLRDIENIIGRFKYFNIKNQCYALERLHEDMSDH